MRVCIGAVSMHRGSEYAQGRFEVQRRKVLGAVKICAGLSIGYWASEYQ